MVCSNMWGKMQNMEVEIMHLGCGEDGERQGMYLAGGMPNVNTA